MVQNPHQTGGIAPLEARLAGLRPPAGAADGGNCAIRAATRRRHAEERLLMVQNPQIAPASGTAEPGGAASVPGGRPWPGQRANTAARTPRELAGHAAI